MQSPLNTSNLSIGYHIGKNREIILHKEINLELHAGEITCLLGPNGSGKSTLIRTMCGLQQSLAGEVSINGRQVEKTLPGDLSKLVSVVLTGQLDISNMSVFSIVAFGRSPYTGFFGALDDHDREVVEKSIQSIGIEQLQHRKFETLSDGEKQKVLIAKSLAQETPIILLDEPTAFLDFPGKVEIMQLLRKAAWEHDKAILLSTHDINLALQFADRMWLMGKDKPIATGVPEDLVLSGGIAAFFDKEKVRFEPESGRFVFNSPFRGNVALSGKGLVYDWLIKSLKRKGYQVVENKMETGDLAAIDVNEEIICIEYSGKMAKVNSITEALKVLEDSAENKT
jgi:iron complex transport system ATP-binding protein